MMEAGVGVVGAIAIGAVVMAGDAAVGKEGAVRSTQGRCHV